MIIFSIRVYQRYAPDSIRLKCRFEPSCSEYMIQSIQKYGLIKGLVRGMKRLSRCNIDGGGYDYP
nr:membrane protein insertion efficiency factor YidD [Ruminococcus flavefaciens]